MKLKRKISLLENLSSGAFVFSFLLINSFMSIVAIAQEDYDIYETELGNNTKSGYEKTLDIPSNPFELVEMIRRANSFNDATNPSDAIDDALKSFDKIKDK